MRDGAGGAGRQQTISAPSSPSPLEILQSALAGELARVAELEAAVAVARQSGEAEGHRKGLAEGLRRNASTLAALQAGVETAVAGFRTSVNALERLAPLVARTALEQVLGPNAPQGSIVKQALERQLERIAHDAIVAIEVSAKDFDAAALAGISTKAGPRIERRIATDLPSGACRFKLKLGAEEIDPDYRWNTIATALAALATPRARTP